MKKIFLFFLVSFSNFCYSQQLKDIFKSHDSPILYLGIDFTMARLIDDSQVKTDDLINKYFPSINDLIINEPTKYDLSSAFRNKNIEHNLGYVTKMNRSIDLESITSFSSKDFNRLVLRDIETAVKKYQFDKNDNGIGLIFFVEGMSKSLKGESVWVTFIDMQSKNVLFSERVVGNTRGAFGFRNFWAAPIRDIIEQIDSNLFKEWASKYARK